MESKSIFLSKTFYGALMVVGAVVAGMLGYTIGDAEGFGNDLLTLVGAGVAVYGRVKAVKKIGPVALPTPPSV
jgi:uncharacterized protein YcfJ